MLGELLFVCEQLVGDASVVVVVATARTGAGQRAQPRSAPFQAHEKLWRRVVTPKRTVKIEGFALERGAEADSQLQLIDVALEDSPLHFGDQFEVAIAIERRRDRPRGAKRFWKRRLCREQPLHVAVDPALERVGIDRYGQPGELFDPALHEAVAQQPSDAIEAGLIVEIYQAGYRLGAAVIRPARVLVAA